MLENAMLLGDFFEGQTNNTNQANVGVKENSTTSPTTNPTGLDRPLEKNVMGAWLLVAACLIGLTLLLQRFSPEQTFAHVKIGFYNMVVIGFYAVLFITLGKVAAAKYPNNPVSVLFLSA